jgi:hypothetical protein
MKGDGAMTTSKQQQSAQDIMARKMEAVRALFQKVVRIMTGKPIRVRLDSGPPFPGWTDGQDIYLNGDLIAVQLLDPNFTDSRFFELIMRLWGIVYHEMCHIQETPRAKDAGSVTAKAIDMTRQHRDRSWWYSANALEDQRIETGFTARYRPTGKFFEAAVLEWLMRTPERAADAHLLVTGRLYLPPMVRQVARAAFEAKYGSKLAQEAEDVVRDYLPLVFPRDDIKGWQCVERYHRILNQICPDPDDLMPQPSEDNDPRCTLGDPRGNQTHQVKKGKQSQKAQQDAADEMDNIDWDADRYDDDEETDATDEVDGDGDDAADEEGEEVGEQSGDDGVERDGEPCDSGDSGSDGDDGDSPGEGEDEGDTGDGGTSGDSDGDAESDTEADPSDKSWGSGSGTPSEPNLEDALEELQRQVQEALDDAIDEVAVDVDDMIDDIYEQMRVDDGLAGNMQSADREVDVEPVTSQASDAVVEALQQLRLDLEAQKVQRQMAGRLNMRRALMVQDHQLDVFDRWDVIGEEAGGIEVVICVDLSGSMGHIMGLVSRILWALKHAFDQLQIRCTVLGYSDDWCVLYRPGETADTAHYRLFGDISGTMPLECLQEAVRILLESQCANRALVTVTDGCWGPSNIDETPPLRRTMEALHANGGDSLIVGLDFAVYGDPDATGTYYGSEGFGLHHHQSGKDIDSIEQLPDAVLVLVESMLKRAIALNMPV